MPNSSKHAKAPRARETCSSDSLTSTEPTGTTESSTHTSATNYGLRSLLSDTGEENIGRDMTPEEVQWLKLAHEFTSAEKPFREKKKTFRVVRKLRTWHPRRGVTWSFLRRLYNGRQDIKDSELTGISELTADES